MTAAPSRSASPESAPFLLVRPSSGDVTDVLEDEEDAASKSVPPRPPPSSVRTTETTLPSVIVDLKDLEAADAVTEAEEEQRQSDVDGLLEAIEAHATARDSRRVPTLHGIERDQTTLALERPRGNVGRNVALSVVAACVIAGTTFAGLRAYHVSPHALSAALHLAR